LPGHREDKDHSTVLSGTTLHVYRYLYRSGKSLGIHEIQRGLALSSSSLADYHLKKLMAAGLVKEDPGTSRYYVDNFLFENMIRVGRSLLPLQISYSVFFIASIVILLTFFRPQTIDGAYLFSIVIIGIAVAIFSIQSAKTWKTWQ
jgi:hypothetical protein